MAKFGDIFEGSGLDAVHERRLDTSFLLETALSEGAVFLPFYNTHPLFQIVKSGMLHFPVSALHLVEAQVDFQG